MHTKTLRGRGEEETEKKWGKNKAIHNSECSVLQQYNIAIQRTYFFLVPENIFKNMVNIFIVQE